MNNKTVFVLSAFFLISLVTTVSARAYIYDSDIYNVYGYNYQNNYYGNYYNNYYNQYSGYRNYFYDYYDSDYYNYKMPIVLGPYPRQYLWRPYDEDTLYTDYLFDDFHGYDSFIGYKDLDIFYPDGTVEVIRNPNSGELPAIDNPEGYGTFGSHVYGYIPGPNGTCLMYKKHYGDDHEWEVQTYDYNQGYDYYAPSLAYSTVPSTCTSCQQKSICQLTHNCQ